MATKPVNAYKGANGLAALIKENAKTEPSSGGVYVSKPTARIRSCCYERWSGFKPYLGKR